MSKLMEIDASVLEGGGQILRISIVLSAILKKPVRIFNIRAGRSKPGLAAQHLKGIQLVGQMCQGKLKGDYIGSKEIEFRPGEFCGGSYTVDMRTAGSISLVLQVAIPCALMCDAPVTINLHGGTNADMAPQIDFTNDVFRPVLKRFGADFNLRILRRGFFPKGGGSVTVQINPVRKLNAVTMITRGDIVNISGISFVSGTLPLRVAEQMSEGAKNTLGAEFGSPDIKCIKEVVDSRRTLGDGFGIILSAECTDCVLGSDGLGKRHDDPFELGKKAAEKLQESIRIGACVDVYIQDQIIIFMALAHGKSIVRAGKLTLHTKTAIHIVELMTEVKFKLEMEPLTDIIECTGAGVFNTNVFG